MLVQIAYVQLLEAVAAAVDAVLKLLGCSDVIILTAAGQKLVHTGKSLVNK